MTVTDTNIEFLAFCLQESPGIGAATLRTILRRMEQEKCDADGFLALDDRTLQARFGLKREAVAFVRSPDSKTLETWQALQQKGVTVLVRGQAGYPGRLNDVLGETAPPILYVLGRTELFQTPSVGFCGSRKASEKGLKVAEDSSRLLAGEQVNVISGYAHGVDLAAHKGALEAGGTTTIVLAEGILHFRIKEQLQDALGDNPLARALVVSEFPPRLPWKAHNAMTRNRTICGLSNAMVVIESGLDGGTFEAGKTSLDLKLPLFCVEYAETVPSAAGNPYFLQHGAISLKRARNGQPNLSKLIAILRDPTVTLPPAAAAEPQLTLHEAPAPNVTRAPQSEQIKMTSHPKRLIEVDLPIKRISAHARREKSIRHGHISTLHIWWARRPLAACRAVICAALWPDPADENCPPTFIKQARKLMLEWTTHERQNLLSAESRARFETARKEPKKFDDASELRSALLDFIADFANWDSSTVPEFLATSRALTQVAHEALGGAPGTRPLVVDPFAGGGSIPLEALRVGADAFASDLNPVPVLLNKVVLEYIPKYGQRLADEVRKWGEWIKREAEKELAEFYPKDADGATPIAYLWVRTIQCEGPGCGAEVPLIRSLWLAKKENRSVALQLVPNPKAKRIDFQIIIKQRDEWVDQANLNTKIENPKFEGAVKRASATCPCCGYTTQAERVREQLRNRAGGTKDARMMAVVKEHPKNGTQYNLPTKLDLNAAKQASARLAQLKQSVTLCGHSFTPEEATPTNQSHRSVGSLWIYGMRQWRDIYTDRQLVVLGTLCQKLSEAANKGMPPQAHSLLALCVGKIADYFSSLCLWRTARTCVAHTFGRQALPIVWDFGEMNPFAGSAGDWSEAVNYVLLFVDAINRGLPEPQNTTSEQADATHHPLPSDSAELFATDPPYYDAVAYAELADYFYVWLKRAVPKELVQPFIAELTPKERQAVVYHPGSSEEKTRYESLMGEALSEGRRVLKPTGIGVVVFAHKSTAGWETMLQAIVGAGWIVTASWPIDTERGGRMNAYETASLASSVHLVCRPRENPDGSVRTDEIGDWRDVLQALPIRIHEWMPRLAEEGVVGADAIFACLGPALEIFSRYSRVEKASGETVTLKEYLEQVWAAVAKEALALVFKDADVTGFEADARLTAMWLWTLNAGNTDTTNGDSAEDDDAEDESEGGSKKVKATGFVLEFDAARKIAQGLGANLETLGSLVEVSGETARLLPVGERARHLFGKDEGQVTTARKKKVPQLDLFKVLEQADDSGTTFGETKIETHGETVLDRIHQSMILFAAGRSEAMKRFLVEDGAGRDPRFWRLAQALSALYPASTEEKRWVDGVLARKKGLGF
jgi:DNA protecting protein DprA